MVGPGRPLFVLFGSSIVQYSYDNSGWGAILANEYARKADILLRGYGGWNSRQALEVVCQVFPKDSAIKPSLVIVYFGGNDSVLPLYDEHGESITSHVPLDEYVENMRKIATHLKSLSKETRLLFLSVPPVNSDQISNWKDFGPEYAKLRTLESCHQYSEACLKLCKELGVQCIDLWTTIQERDKGLVSSFTDGVHFSKEGSKIVADEILNAINEADWEPSLHSNSIIDEFGHMRYTLLTGEPTGNISQHVENLLRRKRG